MAVEKAAALPLLQVVPAASTNNAEEGIRSVIMGKLVEVKDEARKQIYIAGPMMAVGLSLYFLQIVSMMMAGHLGELSLSSTAIAVSLGSVTGFSPVLGMSSALETICGQAYGAGQYRKFGLQIYTAILCLFLTCIPLSILWLFMGRLLVLTGQDPDISHEAGNFIVCLIPALFGYATLQPIIRYFQMQSLGMPMLLSSSCATILCHVVLCWALVFKLGLGNVGAALAMGFSYWLDVVLLGLYMMYSPSCAKTRVNPISIEVVRGIREFFSFAIPSTIMICLDWWSYELLTLLSGLLPNPKLEASVLSVCLSTVTTLYIIPDSLGAAVSTRVSNELGAGNAYGARLAVITVMVMAISEVVVVSSILFSVRHSFGYIFSNEVEVVGYAANIAPLVCLAVILDAIHAVLSGVSRGCGWQGIGAYINLVSYYVFGIPVSVVLGFRTNLGGTGLWLGILVGSFVQSLLLIIVTMCTDWEKRVHDVNTGTATTIAS